MILARLEPRESTERRGAPRRRLKLDSAVSIPSGGDLEVIVHDLSATGLLIETGVDLRSGDELAVEIPGAGPTVATVMWVSGNYFGCEFKRPVPKAALSAAALRSPPAPPPSAPAAVEVERQLEFRPMQARAPKPDFEFAPLGPTMALSQADDSDQLSPLHKLLILLGLSVAGWAFVATSMWVILTQLWH